MFDFSTFVEAYWKYYITIEHRFLRTEEYLAFDEANSKAFSIEYLSLLQIICSEIDVLAKAICTYYDTSFKSKDASILKWGFELQQHFPDLMTQEIVFRESKRIKPWDKCELTKKNNKNGNAYYKYKEGCGSPSWWTAYNKVKHSRTTLDGDAINFQKANQKNVLTSLAALYSLNRFIMVKLDNNGYVSIEKSSIFAMYKWSDELVEHNRINPDGTVTMVVRAPWR